MLDLQGSVDSLAQRLERAVAIDNVHVEVIVTSAQIGKIDDARRSAVLQRRTPGGVVEYVKSLKLEQREGPVIVPGSPELNTLNRICYPLRAGSTPLGYLWLIDEPPVGDRDVRIVEESLPDIIEGLLQSDQMSESVIGEAGRLADQALSSKGPEALIKAHELQLLPEYRMLALYRCSIRTDAGDSATAPMIRRLIEDLVSTTYPGNFICTVYENQLVGFTGSKDAPGQPLSFISAVGLSAKRCKLAIDGIGVARVEATQWEAVSRASENAKRAVELSETSSDRQVVRWEESGMWKLLLGNHFESDPVAELSEPVAGLIRLEGMLAQTLWAYFDSGRDAQATCERLHIHRATLYYRLKRIQEALGQDLLVGGETSLNAHLALQYWQRLVARR